MKKIIIFVIIFVSSVGIANAWYINDYINKKWYPVCSNNHNYNMIRNTITDLEYNLELLTLYKDQLLIIQDLWYLTSRKEVIKNLINLIKELRTFNYLIK